MPEPARIGSYREDDVTILLTDLSGTCSDGPARSVRRSAPGLPDRILPPAEYQPSARYLALVRALVARSADRVALACAALAEQILSRRGSGLVMLSIARAGTPVGVLLKRWIRYSHGQETPHYSISVARDAGLDLNAVEWLCQRHDPACLQFVDAWTSKGTIQATLDSAVSELGFPGLDPTLAVLTDQASCTDLFATRQDVILPHACLGATMSGLLSRTFPNPQPRGDDGFHAVLWYPEQARDDFSNRYIETISSRYPAIRGRVRDAVRCARRSAGPDGRGLQHAHTIARRYGAADFDLVNVGTSESTRAFFRRKPDLLLVHPRAGEQVAHLLQLADERDVTVCEEPSMPFRAALL